MEEITSRSAPNFPHRNGQSRQLAARNTRGVGPATKRGGIVEWPKERGDLRQPWGGAESGAGIRRGMGHMDREEELANELARAHNEAAEDKKRLAELQQCLQQAAEEKDATVREGMQAEMVRFKKEFEEKAKAAAEHDKLRAMLAEEKLKTSYGHEAMIKELEALKKELEALKMKYAVEKTKGAAEREASQARATAERELPDGG